VDLVGGGGEGGEGEEEKEEGGEAGIHRSDLLVAEHASQETTSSRRCAALVIAVELRQIVTRQAFGLGILGWVYVGC
jgi:hypothetical protein